MNKMVAKYKSTKSKHALITHYVALNTRTYLIIIKRLWLRRQKKACKICILIIWCNPVNYNYVNIFWYACESLYLRFRLLHCVSKWYTKYIYIIYIVHVVYKPWSRRVVLSRLDSVWKLGLYVYSHPQETALPFNLKSEILILLCFLCINIFRKMKCHNITCLSKT